MLVVSDDWELTDEGEMELDVYDVETENHMFFGNDILLHNSFYIDISSIYKKYNKENISIDKKIAFGSMVCDMITNKAIEPHLKTVSKMLNTYQNTLDMKREVICTANPKTGHCGFWTAKKHYILLVNDSEGYTYPLDHPKMKIMGLSMIQSSTPEYFREKLSKASRLLLEEGEDVTRKYIKDTYKEFTSLTPEEIALPRSVSDIDYEDSTTENNVKLGTPIQSRASIYHNKLLEKFGIKDIEPIGNHDKIKFLYLKENPEHINVIGFKEKLPKQFNLHKYADYDTHFEKAFKKPMEDIFKACGLQLEETVDIDSLFD